MDRLRKKRLPVLVLVSSFIVCSNLAFMQPVLAFNNKYDRDFYMSNGVLFYNPEDTACSSTEATVTQLSGSNDHQKIWNYLVARGLSSEQAAGVMGYIEYASNFVPTRYSDDKAWGLLQWSGSRLFEDPDRGVLGKISPDLKKYSDESFDTVRHPDVIIPPKDLDALILFQLNYAFDESSAREVTVSGHSTGSNEWQVLKLQSSVDLAAAFWAENFGELDKTANADELSTIASYANSLYGELNGIVTSGGSNGLVCNSSGSLESKVLEYAWPDYHKAPYTDKKPEYAAAINEALSNGGYVGGGIYPGIDCGGFVTRLIVDSGYDPTYNYNGKKGDGAGATPVQKRWLDANWDSLGKANEINVADLQPGDVAITSGHTFIYVGQIDGFNSNRASASIGGESGSWRTPMAGKESLTDSGYTWYRKVLTN